MADVFLLTKTPGEPRSKLCFKLLEYSENSKLYLAGDGVLHLLKLQDLPSQRTREIVACKEDMLARGVPLMDEVTIPDDFYRQFVEDMMENADHVCIF